MLRRRERRKFTTEGRQEGRTDGRAKERKDGRKKAITEGRKGTSATSFASLACGEEMKETRRAEETKGERPKAARRERKEAENNREGGRDGSEAR